MMREAAGLPDIIHLEVGEPSFDTPAPIIDAAVDALRSGATRYTPTAGTWELREAVAARATKKWGRQVTAQEVVISAGAVNALAGAILATVSPGDEILLPDPGWPNYVSLAMLSGATARFYRQLPENGFLPSLDEIRSLITPRTTAMLINTPGNPSGAVFPREMMQELVELARETGITLISDEIYEDIVFDGVHTSVGEFSTDAICISGVSKTYAMTGWRIGYAIAPRVVVEAIEKLQEPLISCPSSVSQVAALAALAQPDESFAHMVESYQRRRDQIMQLFQADGLIPVVPEGAFYALVDFRATGLSGMELAQALLHEAQVAVAPGSTFGDVTGSFVRISFALDDELLKEGGERLLRFHRRTMKNITTTPGKETVK